MLYSKEYIGLRERWISDKIIHEKLIMCPRLREKKTKRPNKANRSEDHGGIKGLKSQFWQ